MAFDPQQHFASFDFSACKNVVVAVSGGSDSVGLLVGLHAYFQSLKNAPVLHAVTVDHALRDGSLEEAQAVTALCHRLKISHVIKRWEGAKPLSALQSHARRERRALLSHAASACCANVILTGHTLDDQIETVVMRQKRGSGPGLAGIADASLTFDDRSDGSPIWIARPLLKVTRQDIRDYLIATGISWIDDPSNNNDAFERIAVRKELAAMSDAARSGLIDMRNLTATKREKLAKAACDLLQAYVAEVTPGLLLIEQRAFEAKDRAALAVMLRALIAFAGGSANLGDGQIVETIIKQVASYAFERGAKPWRETSNGALIEIRQSGIYLARDGRKTQRSQVEFDGRYRTIQSGSRSQIDGQTKPEVQIAPASLVRRAMGLEPVYGGEGAELMAAFDAARSGHPLRRLINPWPDLVPHFDLALAQSLNRVAGGMSFPALPVYRCDKK
jgi:tRNA(Ile)-lysidine synthase